MKKFASLLLTAVLLASMLSEGSLTIICTVAAAVVFGLGGFFLARKKALATVGEKSDN